MPDDTVSGAQAPESVVVPVTQPVQVASGLSTPATVVVTAAATMTAASLAPAIDWLLNGCPKPVPGGVALTMAAVLIIAAHGVQKAFTAWLARSSYAAKT